MYLLDRAVDPGRPGYTHWSCKSELSYEDELMLNTGDLKPELPVQLTLAGRHRSDFIRFEFGFLINERVRIAFQRNGITGWTTFPVMLINIRQQNIEGVHGFSVIGRPGPLLSKNIDNGLEIDFSTWDQSDIFTPRETLFIIATERVVRIIEEEKFTGVFWEPIKK